MMAVIEMNQIMLICLFLCSFMIIDVLNFNFENRLPIIKTGENASYFGYKVTPHIEYHGQDSKTVWLLVSAPLGQNLQPNTSRSGAIFKCPLTQKLDDCVQIVTDGRRYDDDDIGEDLQPPQKDEIKNNQWLGVTLQSQGTQDGRVLVCAHRYVLKKNQQHIGQGLCYSLNNDLTFDEAYQPCSGRSIAREHEEYSFCQVGTSGYLLEDGTAVLGSPGPFTWRGAIFVIAIGGDYLTRDKTQYFSEHQEKSPVDKYSYLGMSVTAGKYFNDSMYYAAGAPRSNDNGQVVIFNKLRNTVPINTVYILDGEQFASNFGYELTTADVNGDGLDDLLVSAPFYYGKSEGGAVYVYHNNYLQFPNSYSLKLTGKPESQFGLSIANLRDINLDGFEDIAIGAPYEDQGAVYIHLGSKNGLTKTPSQIVRPSNLGLLNFPVRTFGSSISGGVDLDDNSYPDIMIGSYSSSVAITLLARPIINFKTDVKGELSNIDPSKQGCAADPDVNVTCFTIETCCSIQPFDYGTKSLNLMYKIEAETFHSMKKFSRVYFGHDKNNRKNIIQQKMSLKSDGNMECRQQVVYIKENTRDIQSPIKFRVNYTIVEPPLPNSALENLHPILDQTQADRVFEATFQKDCGIDTICQSKINVDAELILGKSDGKYQLILGEKDDIQLSVDVRNDADSAYEAHLYVEHQAAITYVSAKIQGYGSCTRHNVTVVDCTLGNPMKRNHSSHILLRFNPSELDDSTSKLIFSIIANTTSNITIDSKNTATLAARIVKKAELSIKGRARPEQAFYGGEVKGESAMETFDDIGTIVYHTYEVYNEGPWKAPFLKVNILWPHQVANDKPQGKWLLYLEEKPVVVVGGVKSDCTVSQPVNPLNLKKKSSVIGELMESPELSMRMSRNKSVTFSSEYSKETYSKSSTSSSILNRVRRDRSMIIRAERLVDKDGKKHDVVHMDCNKNTAKCVKIECSIYDMQRKAEAYIYIKARLWNSTLVADYPRVDTVKIVSSATIEIPQQYGIQQNKDDDSYHVETLAYPELKDQQETGIPIWIIIVAILVGLLVLILVTWGLYKCGFFKRRRPDPTLSGNLEKNCESKPFITK